MVSERFRKARKVAGVGVATSVGTGRKMLKPVGKKKTLPISGTRRQSKFGRKGAGSMKTGREDYQAGEMVIDDEAGVDKDSSDSDRVDDEDEDNSVDGDDSFLDDGPVVVGSEDGSGAEKGSRGSGDDGESSSSNGDSSSVSEGSTGPRENADTVGGSNEDLAAHTGEAAEDWSMCGGEKDGLDDLSFEIDPFDLSKVKTRLREERQERRRDEARKCPLGRRGRRGVNGRDTANTEETLRGSSFSSSSSFSARSIELTWRADVRKLKKLKPDFFKSKQARLADESPISQGKAAYFALPLHERNNSDLRSIFCMEFDRKISVGGSIYSYKQLLSVAGQYLRLRVVRGLSDISKLWEEGQLFRAVCDLETIDLFFELYEAKGSGSTVMTKALHMQKIARHAKMYFVDKDRHLHSEAERARSKIGTIQSVYKAKARQEAARRKASTSRLMDGKLFLPEDFRVCQEDVKKSLDAIIAQYKSRVADFGEKEAGVRLERNRGLVDKWCMNMLLMLLFSAGGQRPQVYAQLQLPDENELLDIQENCSHHGFFELRTLKEKTNRTLDMPNVIVPGKVLRYLEFHIRIVRPIVVRATSTEETADSQNPIFMHTRTGEYLETAQVTRCLKKYLQLYQPHLSGATVMSLRSSYGTMMLQLYHEGRVFKDLDEKSFLAKLGKVMNTSAEQLLTTYIGIDRCDFEDTAKKLVHVLDKYVHGEGSSSDEPSKKSDERERRLSERSIWDFDDDDDM